MTDTTQGASEAPGLAADAAGLIGQIISGAAARILRGE
jgi:hypothetical protein